MTKQITAYTISELSDKAREYAHEQYIQQGFDYPWLDEGKNSIKAFCDLFGVTVKDWSYGTYDYSFCKTDADNSNFRGVNKVFVDGLPEFITGYCVDCDLLETFKAEFKQSGNAKAAFDAAIKAGVKSIVADMENCETLESFIDLAEANDYYFLEDGTLV